MNALLDLKEHNIVICGIGTNAKILTQIYTHKGINIIAYVVSDEQKINCTQYNGINVYKMSECSEKIKQYLVVSSVRESVFLKVKKQLEKNNFKNIISANDYNDWIEVLEYFYRSYLKRWNIEIDGSILDINGSQFINGFLLDKEGKYSFLVELGDIILPYYFNDYSICNEGPYELNDIDFGVEEGDVIFDCGANMGLFSILAINKGGYVYSFEPTPHTREYLDKYKEIYSKKISIYPYALLDKNGETDFFIGSNMNGENSINNLSGTCKEHIKVKTKTIDDFVTENKISKVDFIKADIEGAERYLLLGAKETMKKFAPKLAICTYHLNDDPEVLENIILKANPKYKVIHRYKKLYAYLEK